LNSARRRIATLALASVSVLGVATTGASAKTVGQQASGSTVSLSTGQSLAIKLRPADSGSTGYHWHVATRPARSVLRLASNTVTGSYQRFVYTGGGAGRTSLKLQYVPPGRAADPVKTFRLTVKVRAPAPRLGCTPGGSNTIAQNDVARVFKIRRSVTLVQGGKRHRYRYDAYYGCELSRDIAYELDNTGDTGRTGDANASQNAYPNLTLRGRRVGYVFVKGCPFSVNGCPGSPQHFVDSQDLRTGRLIRRVAVDADTAGSYPVSGLLMSAAGGLAWIENVRATDTAPARNAVRRSDLPRNQGEAYATDFTTLDPGDGVDPDSLRLEGPNVTWLRGGALQTAPLR
jgi:predicted secreted protein